MLVLGDNPNEPEGNADALSVQLTPPPWRGENRRTPGRGHEVEDEGGSADASPRRTLRPHITRASAGGAAEGNWPGMLLAPEGRQMTESLIEHPQAAPPPPPARAPCLRKSRAHSAGVLHRHTEPDGTHTTCAGCVQPIILREPSASSLPPFQPRPWGTRTPSGDTITRETESAVDFRRRCLSDRCQ